MPNSEIDKKILEMEFDNKQFESGIKTSMASLDKLKEKLQFNGSSEGIKNVQRNLDSLNLNQATGSLETFTVRLSAVGAFGKRIVENIADSVYSAMSRAKIAVNQVFGMITTGGSNRAHNIEQAKFQLEGLGVAWEQVKDDINYAVKDTAYGLDAAAKAASQLVASNVQLGEEMRFSLRGISGLAAMTNSSYEDIARIFTKVAGQGRLMGDDLNSVAARGINVAAELGKVFNATEAEIRDMVSKGQIDFKTFAKAMDDAFGQHAKDANKTYAGSLANVKAALSRLGADIATTKFETLRDIFNELIPKIDEFKKEFKPAEESIQKLTKSIGKLIQSLIKNVDMPNIAKKVSNVVVKITDKIEYLIDQFRRAIKLVKSIEKIESFKKIQNGAKKTADAISGITSEIEKISKFTGADIIDNTREYNKELQAAKDIYNGVFGILNGQARVDYIKDVLHLDPEIVQDYINQVADGGKTWEEVTLKAGNEAENADKKYKKLSDTIKNIVKTFNAIKHITKNIIESVKNVASVMIESFAGTFDLDFSKTFGKIPKTLTDISDKFKITKESAEKIRPIFDTIFSALKIVIDTIISLYGYIKQFFTWIKNNETIKRLFDSVINFFKVVFDNLSKLKDRVVNSNAFKNIIAAIKPIMSEIGDFISFIFDGISSIITRASDAITNISNGKSFFDAISEFLFGTYEKRTAFYNLVKGGFIVGFIGMIAKALFKMTLFSKDPIFYMFKFLGVLSNLSRVLVTYKYYLRTKAFEAIAKGIGIIVLAVVGMAYYINKYGASSILQAALIIAVMITGLLTIMRWIGRVESSDIGVGTMIKSSIIIRSIALAILSVAGSIYFISSAIDKNGIVNTVLSLVAIIGIIASIVGSLILLSRGFNSSTKLNKVASVIFAMSISMVLIVKALTSLLKVVTENKLSVKDIWTTGLLPIIILIGIMTVAMTSLSRFTLETKLTKIPSTILMMSISMVLIVKALTSLLKVVTENKLSVKDIWTTGLLPIIALIGIMTAAMVAIGNFVSNKATLLTPGKLTSLAVISLALGATLMLMVYALKTLILTVNKNNISYKKLWLNGVLPIIAIFSLVSASLAAMSIGKPLNILLTATGFLVFAAAISAVGLALAGLAKMASPKELLKIIGLMSLFVGIIVAIGAIVSKAPAIIGGIVGISVAILTFGAALAIAAIGVGLADLALIGLGTALPVLATGITDTVIIIVEAIDKIIEEIPKLSKSLVIAISTLAYDIGKLLPLIAGMLVRGFVDGIKEALGINSPSTVFAEIGGYCIEGLWVGIFEELRNFVKWIKTGLKEYIADPFCEFFGIHSPSEWFKEKGKFMIEGLEEGLKENMATMDLSSFSGLGNDISSSLPDMNSIGSELGFDFKDGFSSSLDFSQFSNNMGEAINDAAIEGVKGIDPSMLHYTIEDLVNKPELYDILKAALGKTGVVAAYDSMKEHEDFLAKNPTLEEFKKNLKDYFTEEETNLYNEILNSGTDEDKAGLESYLAKRYMDKAKLDNEVLQYSKSYKESIEKYLNDKQLYELTHGNWTYNSKNVADLVKNAKAADVPIIVKVKAEDDEGNVLPFLNGGTSNLNLDYDSSSVKTNMDAVSGDITNAINAQTTKLETRLSAIETKVGTFDTNQMNRTSNLLGRVSQLESAIRSMQLRLDTGALVGQLVGPIDSALGERQRRKARG